MADASTTPDDEAGTPDPSSGGPNPPSEGSLRDASDLDPQDLVSRLGGPDAFELVAELVHDIRSPLNSVLFLSEVLRSGHSGPVSEHQRGQLGLIYGATLSMISLVNDVMELAREETGLHEERTSAFSVGRVFDSVHEMVRPMAEQKGLNLEFRRPEFDRFMGHSGRIGRVLLNLTTNALKFTESGAVLVEAHRLSDGRVEFSVQDTGPGISQEKLEVLFQPFPKSPYRRGHFFSSTGLGLSIVRRLVQGMDSTLRVQSEVGRGTRFSFVVRLESLPLL